ARIIQYLFVHESLQICFSFPLPPFPYPLAFPAPSPFGPLCQLSHSLSTHSTSSSEPISIPTAGCHNTCSPHSQPPICGGYGECLALSGIEVVTASGAIGKRRSLAIAMRKLWFFTVHLLVHF